MAAPTQLRLACLRCGTEVRVDRSNPHCPACDWIPPLCGGVCDLRDDPARDTALDIENYDADHGVGRRSDQLASVYQSILTERGLSGVGQVLEIGAGSGNLTAGLIRSEFFHNITSTDISPRFMSLLRRRVADGTAAAQGMPDKLRLFLMDANRNPFSDASFDCVLGHSILHHLEYFERTVTEACRVTRPGGVCIFGEPVLDIHVFAGLAARLVLHHETTAGTLGTQRRRALNALANRPTIKRANLEADRTGLAETEDKFIFPIDTMRRLATQAGFTGFDCVSPAGSLSLGQHARQIMERVFQQFGEDVGFLENYAYLFDSLTTHYGEPMRLNGMAPFSYFVFSR